MRGLITVSASALLGLALLYGISDDLPGSKDNFGPPKPISAFVTFVDSYTCAIAANLVAHNPSWPTVAARFAALEPSPALPPLTPDSETIHPSQRRKRREPTVVNVATTAATCNSSLVPPKTHVDVMHVQMWRYVVQSLWGLRIWLAGQDRAVYSLWIGTNDVGENGLLGGKAADDVTIADVIHCSTYDWIGAMYARGARNFLLQTMIPLELTPLYRNSTKIQELVQEGNELLKRKLIEISSSEHFPQTHIGLFDTHALFTKMHQHPESYFSGRPATSHSSTKSTTADRKIEIHLEESIKEDQVPLGPDRAKYLWFDELHPSIQADEAVAMEYVKAVNGVGDFVTWFS